ncbi:hypothetical protein [Kitasatospora phosalacinea]|uniref:hypothetical protein n=1 Tax=Kitasatospora phosalacinea TaxID=2065 RepID=UPI000526E3BE|nr:hypothetical protein [Kitasatospora phosalacinea]
MLPLLLPGLDEDGGPFRAHDLDDVADLLGAIGPAAAAALPRLREHAVGLGWTAVHYAAALWAVGGEGEAPAVLDVLLPAWEANVRTDRVVLPCLERMGPAVAPAARSAVPLLRAWPARPGRGGLFSRIDRDEELRRVCRAVLAGLGEDTAPDASGTPAAWRAA